MLAERLEDAFDETRRKLGTSGVLGHEESFASIVDDIVVGQRVLLRVFKRQSKLTVQHVRI